MQAGGTLRVRRPRTESLFGGIIVGITKRREKGGLLLAGSERVLVNRTRFCKHTAQITGQIWHW